MPEMIFQIGLKSGQERWTRWWDKEAAVFMLQMEKQNNPNNYYVTTLMKKSSLFIKFDYHFRLL